MILSYIIDPDPILASEEKFWAFITAHLAGEARYEV